MGTKHSKLFKERLAERLRQAAEVKGVGLEGKTPKEQRILAEQALAEIRRNAPVKFTGPTFEWQEKQFQWLSQDLRSFFNLSYLGIRTDIGRVVPSDFYIKVSPHDFDTCAQKPFFDEIRRGLSLPAEQPLHVRFDIDVCGRIKNHQNNDPRMYWLRQARQGDVPEQTHYLTYETSDQFNWIVMDRDAVSPKAVVDLKWVWMDFGMRKTMTHRIVVPAA